MNPELWQATKKGLYKGHWMWGWVAGIGFGTAVYADGPIDLIISTFMVVLGIVIPVLKENLE